MQTEFHEYEIPQKFQKNSFVHEKKNGCIASQETGTIHHFYATITGKDTRTSLAPSDVTDELPSTNNPELGCECRYTSTVAWETDKRCHSHTKGLTK